MKLITRFLLVFVACTLLAQVQLVSSVTISGTSAAVALASSDAPYWVQFVAPSANMGTVRIGDSNTSSSRGIPLAAGAGFMMPPISGGIRYNSLSTISVYVASGDTLVVSWAK